MYASEMAGMSQPPWIFLLGSAEAYMRVLTKYKRFGRRAHSPERPSNPGFLMFWKAKILWHKLTGSAAFSNNATAYVFQDRKKDDGFA
jgi:hypothetical protein